MYHATSPAHGRRQTETLLQSLHTCPVPVARLGRTLRQWREEIIAYFTTAGVSTAALRPSTASSKRPATRSRLPQLHQLPAPDPARRRRLTALPTPLPGGSRIMLKWEEPRVPFAVPRV